MGTKKHDVLREMYENEAWIDLEYLGDELLSGALGIDPVVALENQHRLAVTMTRRGQIFSERECNPESRHACAPSTKAKNGSQIPRNESIANIVKSKERGYRKPKNQAEVQERIAASIVGRRGQQEFRQKLLRRYKKCVITGCDAEEVLEAAHIQAYSEAGTFEVSNGLLLRADIHTLFDLGLITIDTSDMTVITAEELKNTVYGEFNKKKLHFPKGTENVPDRKALHDHHQSAMQRQQQAFML
jgi:HNH endonuclease